MQFSISYKMTHPRNGLLPCLMFGFLVMGEEIIINYNN